MVTNVRGVQVDNEVPLEAASEMLGCDKHHLRNALLTRSLAAGGESGAAFLSAGGSWRTIGGVETLTIPLKKVEAVHAKDKLVQEVRVSAHVRGVRYARHRHDAQHREEKTRNGR